MKEKTLFSEGIFLEIFWVVITKNLFERLDCLGENPFIEGNLKSNFLNEFTEGVLATELAEFNVLLPRVVM